MNVSKLLLLAFSAFVSFKVVADSSPEFIKCPAIPMHSFRAVEGQASQEFSYTAVGLNGMPLNPSVADTNYYLSPNSNYGTWKFRYMTAQATAKLTGVAVNPLGSESILQCIYTKGVSSNFLELRIEQKNAKKCVAVDYIATSKYTGIKSRVIGFSCI